MTIPDYQTSKRRILALVSDGSVCRSRRTQEAISAKFAHCAASSVIATHSSPPNVSAGAISALSAKSRAGRQIEVGRLVLDLPFLTSHPASSRAHRRRAPRERPFRSRAFEFFSASMSVPQYWRRKPYIPPLVSQSDRNQLGVSSRSASSAARHRWRCSWQRSAFVQQCPSNVIRVHAMGNGTHDDMAPFCKPFA